KATGKTTQHRLLKWIAHTILLAGLLTFSGHITECRILAHEPAKTELREQRSVRYKSTTSLKAFLNSLSIQPSCTEHFIFSLADQHKKITVQLKKNGEKFAPEKSQGFLIHHAFNYSKEHDSSQLMG